jgi:hypothetical protein
MNRYSSQATLHSYRLTLHRGLQTHPLSQFGKKVELVPSSLSPFAPSPLTSSAGKFSPEEDKALIVAIRKVLKIPGKSPLPLTLSLHPLSSDFAKTPSRSLICPALISLGSRLPLFSRTSVFRQTISGGGLSCSVRSASPPSAYR